MTDGATLKIYRATKHISDLDKLLRENRPYVFVLKTNTHTGNRTLVCEKNETITEVISLLSGDAIHNLRTAFDHVYYDIVSPHCTEAELGGLQFPFCSEANRIDKAIRQRKAHYAGTGFYFAVRKLALLDSPLHPDCMPLFLINYFDIIDKHRLLLPAIDETTPPVTWIRTIDPQIPWSRGIESFTMREQEPLEWINNAIPPGELGEQVGPNEFKRQFDVPIVVSFPLTIDGNSEVKLPPVLPMLLELLNAARDTITIIRKSATTY